ncbi:MAG TPA: tRNA lysidine(34) synthetase TilS [Anaeromyxobacter sp.]|nr:tRNA lysidine(34) synthetase TilS [Anaeromyxobacter sp.]
MRNPALHPFVLGVLSTVRRRKLLERKDRVLVALSAGPDSTALLSALATLREAGEVEGVRALYVDHGLRAGSAEDGDEAGRTCLVLKVPFARVRVEVPAGNVQAQARRVRYLALRAEALRTGATRIATGHTRSDQAETVLFRLLRGSGARGLSGIPPRRGRIVRPLIDRSREEVMAFLSDRGLAFREDPSNAAPRYARNRVRHELLPLARRLAPGAERALARAADLLRADERALKARARACAPAGEAECLRLLREPKAVQRRVVRALWRRAPRGKGELSAAHVEAVLALLRRVRPWRLSLPGGVEARCRYGRLEIGPGASRDLGPPAPILLGGPGRYLLAAGSTVLSVEARRPDLVGWPLELRTRRPGDRFGPEGGSGQKKLKAWLIDRKVPRERRDALWLVTRGPTVLAVPELGVRAREAGGDGPGLVVRIEDAGGEGPDCKKGERLL